MVRIYSRMYGLYVRPKTQHRIVRHAQYIVGVSLIPRSPQILDIRYRYNLYVINYSTTGQILKLRIRFECVTIWIRAVIY